MGCQVETVEVAATQHLIDSLTGFGNRRKLIADLEQTLAYGSAEKLLIMIHFSGLIEYTETHGLLAGDALIVRLAKRLTRAVGSGAVVSGAVVSGDCYRSRGDEFCALISAPMYEVKPILDKAVAGLNNEGKPCKVKASLAAAFLPDEATDPTGALEVVDGRLAALKDKRERRRTHRAGSDR